MEQEEIGKFRRALPQFIAVSIKNILLFVYGMTLGFPTIVIPSIQGGDGREPSDIVLSRDEISWFSSINLICVPLGCLFSGLLTQPIGKRRAMQFVNLPILASWLLFHFANRTEHLYAALCFSGLGGGLMEAPVLTYVAEITEPEYRGILSALGSTCVITGVFIQFIMGSLMDWRTVAAVSSAFPVISIIALCFVPESPTWLIRERRFKEAVKALQWLRGWVPEHKIEPEFNRLYEDLITKPALEEAHENTDVRPSKLKSFFRMFRKRSFLAPFALVALTFFTGHFSGKTSLQTYAVQIFHTLKAPINKYHATILLGVAEMIATIMCVCLIHFTGKRPLVLVSTIGVSVCFFGTATYAHYLKVVPGFAVDNVVANASSIVPKQNIISQKNISDIFESEQKALLRTSQNSDLLKNGEYNDSEITTILPTDIIFETTGLNNILNRTSRETPIILAADGIRIDDNNTENYRNEDIIPDSQTNRNKFNYEIYNDTNTDNETDTYPDSTASEQMDELVPTTKIPAHNTTSGGSKKPQNFNSNPSSTEHDGIDLLLTVPQQEKNYLVWLPLVLLLGSAFFAHLGIRMIPWILIGEVFPAPVRSTASGLVSALGYIFGFLANKLFLQMLVVLTLPGTFWFYSAVAISGATILFFILPETEGRTLAEIEAHFSKKSSVNLLDKSSNAKKVQETSIQLENLQNLHIPRGSLSHPKALAVQPRDLNAKNGPEILGKDNAAFEGNHTTQM